jgi:hypothetical protein
MSGPCIHARQQVTPTDKTSNQLSGNGDLPRPRAQGMLAQPMYEWHNFTDVAREDSASLRPSNLPQQFAEFTVANKVRGRSKGTRVTTGIRTMGPSASDITQYATKCFSNTSTVPIPQALQDSYFPSPLAAGLAVFDG